jgi:PAS domain S-box-containing protein
MELISDNAGWGNVDAMKPLESSPLRLAAVIESSDDAIITHGLDGAIESWNRAAERTFGYTVAEALGKSIELIIPPDRRNEERAVIERLQHGENVAHFETLSLTKDRSLIPVSLTISPVRSQIDEIVSISRIVRDISRQKALEREALRLAAIVESSEDAIVSKDLNGIVQTWNKAAERMFGYTAEEVVGRHISLIIPSERLAEEDHVLSSIRSGRAIEHFETVRRHKDGSPVEISLSVSPIRTAGGVIIGASKIARDISAQRRLAREAEEANRIKDEFLATLSHELRTPLNAVLGYTRMLRMANFGEDRRERTIEIIERNANILSQLVSDVLDVSAIVTGKIRLKAVPADLMPVVAAAIDVIRPSAAAKGISLAVEAPSEEIRVLCDVDRMQQVLWNLLSNAIKFTPGGGQVRVEIGRRLGAAELTVTDTGIGVKKELLPQLFQRFWQGEAERQAGSLGLGLALARHFVELHGGTIAATSQGEGKGTTITVRLPLLDAASGS